jgi:hypothetical protein
VAAQNEHGRTNKQSGKEGGDDSPDNPNSTARKLKDDCPEQCDRAHPEGDRHNEERREEGKQSCQERDNSCALPNEPSAIS